MADKIIYYIGPLKVKHFDGYDFPFGEPVEVDNETARKVLPYKTIFTSNPAKVPDQAPSRIRLLRAEIQFLNDYREQYRDDLTFAKREKDKERADITIAACQREMGYADKKIAGFQAELDDLLAANPEPVLSAKEKAKKAAASKAKEPAGDQSGKAKRTINTGTPVEPVEDPDAE